MKNQSDGLKFFGFNKLTPFIKPYKGIMLAMIIFGIGVSMTDTFIPVFQKYALDHFIKDSTFDTLPAFALIYIAVVIGAGLMNYISTYMSFKTEMYMKRDLRDRVFEHIQTLSFSYFNQNSVGYIHARVMSDVNNIGEMLSWKIMDGIWRLTYVVSAIGIMLAINVKLALMVIAIIPILFLLFSFFQRRLVDINRRMRELNAQITHDFNEEITGAKAIKSLAIEKKMIESFLKDTGAMRDATVRASHVRGAFAGVVDLASSLALALVLWQGGILVGEEVGTFSLFMAYAQGMMEPVRWVVECISELTATRVNIERFISLIETKPDVTDAPAVIQKYGDTFQPIKANWEPVKGDIEFKNVTFRYPDGAEYILRNFNLKIPFGFNAAIVGETGAGKSTLVNLICRFFEPTEGQVLIDGRDSRERSQLWLHSAIGYVLQTPHLFSGTVRANLLYGNAEATEADMYRALELVSAREMVDNMEKGLDSDVGEGGELLSAGEKQLISFARAVIANPKILILDEATASVDTITEQKLQNAMNAVIKGRTSIVIAHRLSTVRHADVILVAQNGRIIERGRHDELMRSKGYYYNLYMKQYEDEATSIYLK